MQGTSTGFGGETSTASPTKASSKPAKDISHMIRKKVCRYRKSEYGPLCFGNVVQCWKHLHIFNLFSSVFFFLQRKPEDEPEDDEAAKKARQESGKKEPAEDEKAGGDGPTTNGTAKHVNGTNGVSPEKTEVYSLPVNRL